jgi:hypothetical protein
VDTSEPPADLAPLVAAVEDQVEGFFGSYLPGPALPTVLRPVRAFFGAATMPPAARDALGLEWRRRHEAAFRLFRAAGRPTYRPRPARIRFEILISRRCVASPRPGHPRHPADGGDARRLMDWPGWPSQSVRGSARAPAANVPAATAASTRRFR